MEKEIKQTRGTVGERQMAEIWRDIKGYEGLYQVSNLGRVKSLERYVPHNMKTGKQLLKERILIPVKNYGKCEGYYYSVMLRKDNKSKHYLVHRLVAMTFPDLVDWTEDAKGKPFDELQVNHKDELDKTNNRVDNLEWCTCKYNNNYGTHIERQKDKMINCKSLSKPVLQYTLDGQFVAEYPSIREASRQTGININGISRCCRGDKRYSHSGGYVWFYKEDIEKYKPMAFVEALKAVDREKRMQQMVKAVFDWLRPDNNDVEPLNNAD